MKIEHALAIAAVAAIGGLFMFRKSETYKDKYGCRTCRYGKKSLSYGECLHCERQRGTNWKTKKVHCECCGQVKP